MGYTGHTVTRPRSILVILGGVVAWGGIVGGVLLTTPQYHLAMTMKEEPVEMTWHELVENGLTDNSHVRLVDVAIEENEPAGFFEEMFDVDPEAPLDDQQEAFEDLIEDVNIDEVFDSVMQPLKIYPAGEDPDKFPAKIVVPIASYATDEAIRQIEETGTLTGRFSLNDGTSLSTRLMKTVIAAEQATAAQGAEQDADKDLAALQAAAAEIDGAEPADLEDALFDDLAEVDETAELKYVFETVDMIPNVHEAGQWFWLSGFAVAVGLVICGAGGPSIVCCFFFMIPSTLSLFGYPMRYGRASRNTRIFYAAVGLGLIGYGYDVMVVQGGFGQLDGDLVKISLGFLPTFFGFAALLGAGSNLLIHRLNISLEPATKKSVAYEPKISLTEACSLEPIESESSIAYEARYLTEPVEPLSDDLAQIAEALKTVGFEEPETVAHQDGLEAVPVLIQLGCQDMVVADVDRVDGEIRSRLVSVLQDGVTVITLSANTPTEKEMRFGTSGQYLLSECEGAIDMLSAHLEHAISMAEKRDTSVVTFDPSETVDVSQFARRVLADIRTQYGEENATVDPATYGRFHFPLQPVPMHAGA